MIRGCEWSAWAGAADIAEMADTRVLVGLAEIGKIPATMDGEKSKERGNGLKSSN